jgi:hypothetical protein
VPARGFVTGVASGEAAKSEATGLAPKQSAGLLLANVWHYKCWALRCQVLTGLLGVSLFFLPIIALTEDGRRQESEVVTSAG